MPRIERTWSLGTGRARACVDVAVQHPTYGLLHRGRIQQSGRPEPGWQGRWRLVDYDHNVLPDVIGDYLNAEAALIAATAGLEDA